jgi:phosphopantetheine adenylyltransferase
MDFAEAHGASTVIRGIRGVTDFEYEYQLTGMNRQLNDRVETLFNGGCIASAYCIAVGEGNCDLRR